MIGDRIDNDIAPAKSLGMNTVWIRQGYGGLQLSLIHISQPLPLVATQEHSNGTATDKVEEGGDDVKSSCPL